MKFRRPARLCPVRDANNNPVAGVEVIFAVASGGGTVDPTTAVSTGADGIAEVTSWTLGTTGGENTLTVSVIGSDPVISVTFTATGFFPPVPVSTLSLPGAVLLILTMLFLVQTRRKSF